LISLIAAMQLLNGAVDISPATFSVAVVHMRHTDDLRGEFKTSKGIGAWMYTAFTRGDGIEIEAKDRRGLPITYPHLIYEPIMTKEAYFYLPYRTTLARNLDVPGALRRIPYPFECSIRVRYAVYITWDERRLGDVRVSQWSRWFRCRILSRDVVRIYG
jgi:hypothetical protein